MVEQIAQKGQGLTQIEDYIDPYGYIMAGDAPPFWKTRKFRR